MNIILKVKDFVEQETKKPGAFGGQDIFNDHFKFVVEYGIILAKKLGGDIEIIEISGWLHDIGTVVHGRKNHHITGSLIAEKKLLEFGYSKEKIAKVKKCILNHRGSTKMERTSLEEKIIAEADAISAFFDLVGLVQFSLIYEGLSKKETKKSILNKLERKWKKLHFEESKKIVEERYNAIKLLLSK